ncbi:unnamed protein product [Pneumocystis jirovecii]|uniref:Uncharacterized protein n=1 Tax=Pneumocystis jirovecii TaxID=42068 RepID=L0PG60_PNEJI|nr:unnamed protein product [Pneumocystis jirovecii]
MSSYAREVSPAMSPAPFKHSTPNPSSAPIIAVILNLSSPFSIILSATKSFLLFSLNCLYIFGVKYKYLNPFSGFLISFHATEKCGISSSERPMRAPELADKYIRGIFN